MVLCKSLPEPAGDLSLPVVYHGLCLLTRVLESAGSAFFNTYERSSVDDDVIKKEEEQKQEHKEYEDGNRETCDRKKPYPRPNSKTANVPSKLDRLIKGPNLYTALGLEQGCSTDSVKRAYRQLALQYHPDKQKARENSTLQDEEKNFEKNVDSPSQSTIKRPKELEHYTDKMYFLLIQDAYNALSDPVFRKQYDSALPFDESIPLSSDVDSSNPQSFFDVFTPVFHRNARWSSNPRVPSLGQMQTPIAEVHRFYQFWRRFQSTREFSIHNEYDTLDAECREERRWMERENMKIRRKYIKEEKMRLNRLVDLAFSLDPRIHREKEEEIQKKQNIKNEKQRLLEEKLEKRKTEESRRKQEQYVLEQEALLKEKQRIEERQRYKLQLKTTRKEIRTLCGGAVTALYLNAEDLEDVCLTLPFGQLLLLLESLQKLATKGGSFQDISKTIYEFLSDSRKNQSQVQETADGETSFDAKEQPDPTTSPQVEAMNSLWTPEEIALLESSMQRYPVGTIRRWQLISDAVGTKSFKSVIAKSKELVNGTLTKTRDSGPHHPASSSPKPSVNTTVTTPTNTTTTLTSSVNSTFCALSSSSPWTAEQQQALELALQSHQGRLNLKEEWIAIAEEVPGKTGKECFTRFKKVRAAILASSGRQNA